MRKSLTLFLAVTSLPWLPAPAKAQSQPSAADLREIAKENEARQEELINIEREIARAILFNNGTIFRRVYGDDFIGVMPSGQVKDKTAWIGLVENSGNKYTSFVTSDIKIRMFQDTAVVTCLWSTRGNSRDGQAFSSLFVPGFQIPQHRPPIPHSAR